MPTYGYKCSECGYTFEIMHGMTDDPIKKCPRCQGAVNKLINACAGIIVKGSSGSKPATCCGREERCDVPPCENGLCQR